MLLSILFGSSLRADAAAGECGGFGHVHDGTWCHCDAGYTTAADDELLCVPISSAPLLASPGESWAAMLKGEGETPGQHVWHLLEKEENESIGINEVQIIIDAMSGIPMESHADPSLRRLLAEGICGGHGHPHGSECHCDSGYVMDPEDSMNCLSATAPAGPGPIDADWFLTAADVVSYAGLNGTLDKNDLAVALPLISSCQMDPTCSLVVSQPPEEIIDPGQSVDEVELWMAGVASIAFFVVPLVGMSIPVVSARLISPTKVAAMISLGNCLSASMIFALGIMHIIPETVESMYKTGLNYPLNYLLIVVGFFVTLALEDYAHGQGHGPPLPEEEHKCGQPTSKVAPQGSNGSGITVLVAKGEDESAAAESHKTAKTEAPAERPGCMGFFRWLLPLMVFFVAIQFHACLEAIIVGMQTSLTNFWILFAGVIIHKLFVSFAFGVRMQTALGSSESADRWKVVNVYLMMGLWALLPALSLMLGYLTADSINPLTKVVLGSLSGGVFLYMGAYALLIPEFHQEPGSMGCANPGEIEGSTWGSSPTHKYLKYFFLALGILLVALLSLIPHKHD